MRKNERRNIKILGIGVIFCTVVGYGVALPEIYNQRSRELPSLPEAKKDIGNAVCENKSKDSGMTRIIIEGQQYKFVCGS